MNEDLTHTWLDWVWGKLSFGLRLLCWDAYCCHIQPSTKLRLKKLKTDAAVIPGGCTGLLQAPDVCWNKPFKAKYRELYEAWLGEGDKQFTRGGNTKPPTRSQLATWVKKAWDSIPTELIKKSFVVCGVSNALDNSQDELINVLKPDGLLKDTRGEILTNLHVLAENAGDMASIDQESVSGEQAEDIQQEVDNELVDEESDEEDNIPLSDLAQKGL